MYAYKEMLTLDDPQHINLSQHLPFLKGKKVEILIIVEDEDEDETDYVLQNEALMQQIALSQKNHEQKMSYQPTADELNEITGV